jgi:hypothetical protein
LKPRIGQQWCVCIYTYISLLSSFQPKIIPGPNTRTRLVFMNVLKMTQYEDQAGMKFLHMYTMPAQGALCNIQKSIVDTRQTLCM